jgi:hypothetical protein
MNRIGTSEDAHENPNLIQTPNYTGVIIGRSDRERSFFIFLSATRPHR